MFIVVRIKKSGIYLRFKTRGIKHFEELLHKSATPLKLQVITIKLNSERITSNAFDI
jgi:hypothetical protein